MTPSSRFACVLALVGACAPATQAPLVTVNKVSARVPSGVSRAAMLRATERVLAIRAMVPRTFEEAHLVTTDLEPVEQVITTHTLVEGLVSEVKRTRSRAHALVIIVRDQFVEVRVSCREKFEDGPSVRCFDDSRSKLWWERFVDGLAEDIIEEATHVVDEDAATSSEAPEETRPPELPAADSGAGTEQVE